MLLDYVLLPAAIYVALAIAAEAVLPGLPRYGYRDSPFEDMAYRAQAAFSQSQPFDTERWVVEQLRPMLVD